ncbi:cyclic nucleotide-gated ion channel 2 [Phtheirospermum japonicum]|uniref:Cyclic nucleotide-gated ion channel 2 n=1 Tax=Phtheirospermum japonicum TaxID=374723 RepID=A0A830C6R3_9LAMI|nr:cyclic nucleotide-gated ion channel 2 [Phtheirospermum japonicum]
MAKGLATQDSRSWTARIRVFTSLMASSSCPTSNPPKMLNSHNPHPHFSISRWFGIFRQGSVQPDNRDEIEDNQLISGGGECYACTQVGVPVFHSTSCDGAHQPEWEASAGSSLLPIKNRPGQKLRSSAGRGSVLDPRSKRVQRWNRAFLLARGVALAVDPLFFYSLSIGRGGSPCLDMDGSLAAAVTVVRTCVDAVHLCHLWLQFRLAYVSRESMVIGCGKLVWDARAVAAHYLRSIKGFWFDVFVILPVPQFLPKVYHSICLMRKMQKVTGYIFGTIWWGFGLNLIAYFIASHVAGGCWYVLAIQRVASCLKQQCDKSGSCNLSMSCSDEVCYQFPLSSGVFENPCKANSTVGVGVPTFGNDLEPTSQWLEVMFSISAVLSGLMLFTLLIGNIQVFLHAVMAKKRKMQLRCRDMEWWMKRRQLPSQLRRRVRRYERQRWTVLGGDDEMELIKDLPEGLRRDIKRFLCLDLLKKIIREGDLVRRIMFIVHGRVKSSQNLSRGMVATSLLEAGGFFGDELFSWCLRRPFIDRLPPSSATFTCLESTEVFALDSNHLRYITDHFRYKFANERLTRTARYYSSNWRTWAAVNIQLGWRRYRQRTRREWRCGDSGSDRRLRLYAAFFMSIRPHDHLE